MTSSTAARPPRSAAAGVVARTGRRSSCWPSRGSAARAAAAVRGTVWTARRRRRPDRPDADLAHRRGRDLARLHRRGPRRRGRRRRRGGRDRTPWSGPTPPSATRRSGAAGSRGCCAGRSGTACCACTTSRSSTSRPAGRRRWRRWSGCRTATRCCRRRSSCRSPSRAGVIVEVGTWVLHEACRQLADWRDRGTGPDSVAVNVSARQLQRDDFCRRRPRACCAHTGCRRPPSCSS